MRHVLAADIGGTQIRAAVVREDGRILARHGAPTRPELGLPAAAERLALLFGGVAAAAGAPDFDAVGVSTAGPVDPSTGIYRHPPNLPGWHEQTMVPLLESTLDVPVRVGHDATLAALAETRLGHRRGARHLLYVTISTGIGAGIVADGRPVTGSAGGAGEVGHLIVDPGGAPCGVGCPGCLEGAASGAAIARTARAAVAMGAVTTLGADATAAEVFAAADAGDPLADAIVSTAIRHLATGLAGLLAVFDPEVIVLGGGVTAGLRPRWETLIDLVRETALPRYADRVPIEPTTLGDDASLLGAALAALGAAGDDEWDTADAATDEAT